MFLVTCLKRFVTVKATRPVGPRRKMAMRTIDRSQAWGNSIRAHGFRILSAFRRWAARLFLPAVMLGSTCLSIHRTHSLTIWLARTVPNCAPRGKNVAELEQASRSPEPAPGRLDVRRMNKPECSSLTCCRPGAVLQGQRLGATRAISSGGETATWRWPTREVRYEVLHPCAACRNPVPDTICIAVGTI